jgi:hypothetical protein
LKKIIHIFQVYINKLTRKSGWEKNEYFNPEWELRVAQLAAFIPENCTVMDLGCGTMSLKKFLNNQEYLPVDYKQRGPNTIICNFNKYEFPSEKADVYFISGCLEYMKDPEWFLKKCCQASTKLLLSYCTLEEFPSEKDRTQKNWQNNLTKDQIISIVTAAGFTLQDQGMTKTRNTLFIFNRSQTNNKNN